MQSIFLTLLGMSRRQKMAVQLIVDSLAVVLAFVGAMWLRLDSILFIGNPQVWLVLIPAMPVALVLLHTLGVYRAVVRYMAARALQSVLLASLLSGLTIGVTAQVFGLPIPRSVPLIYAGILFLSVGAARYVFREAVHKTQSRRKERVVIYGAGAAGRQLVQTLLQGNEYLPIAFLDDDARAHGSLVAGLRVHPPEKIEQLIRNNNVTSVLLALPSTTKARRNEMLKWLEQYPLHLRTIPGLDDIVSGRARIDDINDISIEDLLGRDPVPPREDLLGANIFGKVVMVTGAGGSIGSELCRQIMRQGPSRLVLFEVSELALYTIEQELTILKVAMNLKVDIAPVMGSVQNRALVDRSLRRFGVQTVYHAAAYKHVPLVEHNVAEGVRNNVLGTQTVAEASVAAGVESFILISTDKAVRPTNIMGATKRLAEMVCQSLAGMPNVGTSISMVRFGNVLGSSGSVIPLFRRQIAAGGPLTVTHPEITRYFMTIPEAALLVIQAGAMARGGDVFVLDMGDPVRIADLAAQMARLHGLKPVLHIGNEVAAPGEIGITFTALRPGEKLYEELLIGNNPQPTPHPRILTATEGHLPKSKLALLLDKLITACDRCDVHAIRRLLVEAQTAYQPQSEVVDHFATPLGATVMDTAARPAAEGTRLTLVSG